MINRMGGSLQSEGFPNTVFQIPLIGEVEQLRRVYKAYKRWRAGGSLRHVIDFQAFSFISGGLYPCHCLRQDIVNHAGGNPHGIAVGNVLNQFKQPVDPLAGFGRNKDNGGIGHKGEILFQLLAVFRHCILVLSTASHLFTTITQAFPAS